MKAIPAFGRSGPGAPQSDGTIHGAAYPPAQEDDAALTEALRRGDEAAFATLVRRHAGEMLRVARLYTDDTALAEDAVQEAWLAVLRGLDRFQNRASLRTWILRILVNRLRTSLRRKGRGLPLSAISPGPDVDRTLGEAGHPDRAPRGEALPPVSGDSPEAHVLSLEARALLAQAIARLPHNQRAVITLRDVDGWSADEVCEFLKISSANQRVLLHRARSRVRRALASYLAEG